MSGRRFVPGIALAWMQVVCGDGVVAEPRLWSAKDLLGAEVVSADGESVGTVSEALLDDDRLHRLVISTGGMLGIGGVELLLDYASLDAEWETFGPRFATALTSDELRALPAWEPGSVRPHQRLNWLLAEPVWNAENEWIGFIDDLFIADAGIVAVIIPVGGFLGIGSHRVAVRFDDLEDDGESFLLDTTRDALLQAEPVDYDRLRSGEPLYFLDGEPVPQGDDSSRSITPPPRVPNPVVGSADTFSD